MTSLRGVGHDSLHTDKSLNKLPNPYLPKIYEKVLADYR